MSHERRILIVDDEPAVYAGICRTMHRLRPEWKFEYASSVAAACERFDGGGLDLVVTDHSMPGGTGLELVSAARAHPVMADVPVIMLTGANQVDLKRQALERGAADLLDKPVDPADLVARIENLLQVHDRTCELEARKQELAEAVRLRTAELEASQLEVIFRLAMLAEYRDETTGNHVIRVGTYAQIIAAELGLDDRAQGEILLAAPLHDVGKVAIPDSVLMKRGKLLDSEWRVMQSHCRIGHEILSGRGSMEATMRSAFVMLLGLGDQQSNNPILECAAEIALSHHERWDGRGYPQALEGEAIPLSGRIVAVADVFDALTSARSYKSAMEVDVAVRLMRMERGRHFDPAVIDAFIRVLPDAVATRSRLGDEMIRREAA